MTIDKNLSFVKEDNGLWYIDYPEWIENGGTKSALQMVAGADDLLEELSQGAKYVTLRACTEYFEGSNKLTLTDGSGVVFGEEVGGGIYKVDKSLDFSPNIYEIWLCDVTKYVFMGEMPSQIYFKKITDET